MEIAVLLATHHLPEESVAWFLEAKGVFGQLVIFIDEQRVTPGTIERARKLGTRVVLHQSPSWYESDFGAMARSCGTEWVFILDYDEQLSAEWQDPCWREILKNTSYTHFWCPRRWITKGDRYICCDPWFPDFQMRLLKNAAESSFPTKLHDPINIRGEGATFRNLAIHHHVLSLCPRPMREDKVRNYEQLRPEAGLGHYYLYEDYAPPEARVPRATRLDFRTEIVSMPKLGAEAINRVELRVKSIPREVVRSTLISAEVQLINESGQALSSAMPHPVRLSYHWLRQGTREVIVFEGNRSSLWPEVLSHQAFQCGMTIFTPTSPGAYILQTTIVQEGVSWFEEVRPSVMQEFTVSVK